jgi:Sulfotransferase family
MRRAHLRPSFFIIGANKCATSSLYEYLVAHPAVLPCAEKEPRFFGGHSPAYIAEHLDDYFALFPTVHWPPDPRYITGEASANTFHDVAPEVLHEHLPDLRLVVIVRDPVARAFSHHRMYCRFRDAGWDPGFDIGSFAADIRAELAAHERGARTEYIGPGLYDELLARWVTAFGARQVKVLVFEDLATPAGAAKIMRELEDYLGLATHAYGETLCRRFNQATPADVPEPERALLAGFYRPNNQRLRERLGRELDWD